MDLEDMGLELMSQAEMMEVKEAEVSILEEHLIYRLLVGLLDQEICQKLVGMVNKF
jgi:hypothetical protein